MYVIQWLRGRFDCVLPARSWEMTVKRELPANMGGVTKTWQVAILTLEPNPPERIFLCTLKNPLNLSLHLKPSIHIMICHYLPISKRLNVNHPNL